jgi:hypothetical protein
MEVIAVAAAEAKADAEERAAGAPPKLPPGRLRKEPVLRKKNASADRLNKKNLAARLNLRNLYEFWG